MSARDVGVAVRVWNRKLHFYIGLYLLLFLWLFSFSGLILNHGGWSFAQFWPQREVTTSEQSVRVAADLTDTALATDIAAQLGLSGESDWAERNVKEDSLQFRLAQPGETITVTVNLATAQASVESIRVNAWGILRALHTFTGMRDPAKQTRDWLPTVLWSVSMDAVAVVSISLVLSGIYMWYVLKPKRRPGLIALSIGTVACAFFVFGLARLF